MQPKNLCFIVEYIYLSNRSINYSRWRAQCLFKIIINIKQKFNGHTEIQSHTEWGKNKNSQNLEKRKKVRELPAENIKKASEKI